MTNKIDVWTAPMQPLTNAQILNVWTGFYSVEALARAVAKSPRTFTPDLAITEGMSKVDESEIFMLRKVLTDACIPYKY